MPDANGLELIAQELRERDAESVVETVHFRDKAALTVTAASIRETPTLLRGKGFNFLASVHGVDHWPEDYVGHPQRRDFPLGGEAVLFTHNEPQLPGWWQ